MRRFLADELFALGNRNPAAAVLRARIAMEEGNLPFALRFLEQRIHQTGDDVGLRETYASALYLTGRWEESKQQLTIGGQLGSPVWRTSYGLGLIEEAQGHYDHSKLRYEESMQAKPGLPPHESRLRALVASGKVRASG